MAGAVSQGGPVTQLADVVDHCVKSRRAGTVPSNVYIGTQEAMYLTCWDTLNAWILARLSKRLVRFYLSLWRSARLRTADQPHP
jgi:hypothetical protein